MPEKHIEIKRDFKEHHVRKVEARKEKLMNKESAKFNQTVHAASFDMDAVLPTPYSRVSANYDKRKLTVHRLLSFSLEDKKEPETLYFEYRMQDEFSHINIRGSSTKKDKGKDPQLDHTQV